VRGPCLPDKQAFCFFSWIFRIHAYGILFRSATRQPFPYGLSGFHTVNRPPLSPVFEFFLRLKKPSHFLAKCGLPLPLAHLPGRSISPCLDLLHLLVAGEWKQKFRGFPLHGAQRHIVPIPAQSGFYSLSYLVNIPRDVELVIVIELRNWVPSAEGHVCLKLGPFSCPALLNLVWRCKKPISTFSWTSGPGPSPPSLNVAALFAKSCAAALAIVLVGAAPLMPDPAKCICLQSSPPASCLHFCTHRLPTPTVRSRLTVRTVFRRCSVGSTQLVDSFI